MKFLFCTLLLAFVAARTLVFSEDFNGTTIDSTKWQMQNSCEVYNNERQCYVNDPSVIYVSNGNLIIKPKYKSTCIGTKCYQAVSGKLMSLGKFEYSSGRYEFSAKLPGGHYMWPALWLFINWDDAIAKGVKQPYGEIDIMESVGNRPGYTSSTLWANNGINVNPTMIGSAEYQPAEVNFQSGFHVYVLEWTCQKLSFFVDGQLIFERLVSAAPTMLAGKNAFTPGFLKYYMILNVAVGGDMFGANDVPTNSQLQADSATWTQMEVDYVRVYADESNCSGSTSTKRSTAQSQTSSSTTTSFSSTTFKGTTTSSTGIAKSSASIITSTSTIAPTTTVVSSSSKSSSIAQITSSKSTSAMPSTDTSTLLTKSTESTSSKGSATSIPGSSSSKSLPVLSSVTTSISSGFSTMSKSSASDRPSFSPTRSWTRFTDASPTPTAVKSPLITVSRRSNSPVFPKPTFSKRRGKPAQPTLVGSNRPTPSAPGKLSVLKPKQTLR